MSSEQVVDTLLFPIKALVWLVALPIRLFAYIIKSLRRYDPEKTVCPACGYRGEYSTNYRSCTIRFIRTTGNEKGALKCTCFRCQCDYATKLFAPAEQWLSPMVVTKQDRIRQAAAGGSL